MKGYWHVILITLLVVTAGTNLWLIAASRPAAPAPTANGKPGPGADPPQSKGGAAAAITVEEFADFQCPPCRALSPELGRMAAAYGGRVRIVLRHFPLAETHRHAVEAARAAEAAGLQGRFWEMHDLLYERQEDWEGAADVRPTFVGYAKDLGLDAGRFESDLDGRGVSGQLVRARVLLDTQRGESLGVDATPTLVVNGRRLPPEEMTVEGLRGAFERALAGAAQAP
jgi:protein-disulfide isomerase